MKVLDLFSGIGGFSLGLERAGMETVAFCEIEDYPRRVLAKHWPNVPIYDDVRTLTGERLRADGITVDVICGGFPCQDLSTAGEQAGIAGERSGLWGEFARLIGEVRPKYAIVENVSALLSGDNGGWFGVVLGDLAALGYDTEWHCIPASSLGAPHRRDRVWVIGYPDHNGKPNTAIDDEASKLQESRQGNAADTQLRQQEMGWVLEGTWRSRKSLEEGGYWETEDSPLGMGVDDGLPCRMDRLRCLGNAVVPQIPEIIGRAIMSVATSTDNGDR